MTKHNTEELFSVNAQALRPSAIEDIHKLLEEPGMRSLAGAWPDPLVFQTQEISCIMVDSQSFWAHWEVNKEKNRHLNSQHFSSVSFLSICDGHDFSDYQDAYYN